ncbi:HNH endonuclease signature motif containing protein [Agromyces silvae]|uniref:HNH endonuclease signature motif containing protein n=1 Tax=Agromyces silvae TaxID=3388266 RepID=UPI00280AA83F|nr:DUF222 domain-containing protein [Agromyces protaetiae]
MSEPPPSAAPASGADDGRPTVSPAPHDGLALLVEAAVAQRRTAARHDAQRLSHVFRVLEFAAAHTESFVSARFDGAPARDLARRAAIAELAVALKMTERRVDRLASDAAVLCRQLPAVLDAMRRGDVDYEQAKAAIDAIEPLTGQPELVAALDGQLAELARTVNPAQLRRATRQLVERVQADSIAARHAKARAERRVEVHPARDGMAWLHLLLPAADALLIKNRLCQAANRLPDSDQRTGPNGRPDSDRRPAPDRRRRSDHLHDRADRSPRDPGSERGLDQLRADLARDLLLYGLPPDPALPQPAHPDPAHPDDPIPTSAPPNAAPRNAAPPNAAPAGTAQPGTAQPGTTPANYSRAREVLTGIRPTVHVTVPVMTLIGRTDDPGTLDGYGPIDADTSRKLASQAPSFTRLLTHPVTSAVLDVDRTSYRVPADLRKWLQVRDQTCRFPGCGRPAIGCDLDHSEDWAGQQGRTAHDNLAHLCAAHHHLKHDTAWSVRHLEHGVLEWTSLTGARYRTLPEGIRTAPPPPASASEHEPPPF